MPNELIGFAVLVGPLWLIVLCLGIGTWAAVAVVKRFRSIAAKVTIGLGIVILALAIPFSDEVFGRVYLEYLCSTQAGTKVYQTIELPKDYWDKSGRPTFYANWDAGLGKKYPLNYRRGLHTQFPEIENAGHYFVDKQSGKTLGEAIDFRYRGGWVSRNLATQQNAVACLDYADPTNKLIDRIFRPRQD